MATEPLAELLNTKLPPGPVGFKTTLQTQEPFMRRKEELQKELTAAEGDIARATQAQAEQRETGKLAAEEAFGRAEKGAMQQYQQKLEAQPLPAFIPTKDTAQDLAGLFSLVSVLGMVAGRGDSQRALYAMNGMLEGYQKGRADLYKKESIEFEKNFKSMLKKHEEFRKEMEDAIKLASTDKQAGMQAAELAATKAGSDIAKAKVRKGDIVGLYALAEDMQKGVGEAIKSEARIRETALKEARADARARQMRETQLEIAKLKLSGKAEKVPNDVEKDVRKNAIFLDNIGDIVEEADALIKQGQIRGIGVIQGKIPYDVAQLYMSKAERDFFQNFGALSNQKLKDQSGATVTGAEFARQRGVLPLRDDQPQVVLDKLQNWKRLVAQETSVIGKAYPSVILKYGIALPLPKDKSKLVPGLEYDTPQGKLLWDGTDFLSPESDEE